MTGSVGSVGQQLLPSGMSTGLGWFGNPIGDVLCELFSPCSLPSPGSLRDSHVRLCERKCRWTSAV